MCLLIIQPPSTRIPENHLRNGWKANPDGTGYAYAVNGKLVVRKAFRTYAHFALAYSRDYIAHPKAPFLIHFRFSTHGGTGAENVHPFLLCGGNVVFAHNGMLFSHESPIPTESDTRFFARTVLAHRAADQIMGKPFQGFLAHLIGGGNKLAFLDATGDISIVNSEYGVWQEGVWYSNTGYLAPPVFDYSRGTHDSEHSYSDLDLLPEDDWVRHNRKSGNWPDDDRVVADWANTSGAF